MSETTADINAAPADYSAPNSPSAMLEIEDSHHAPSSRLDMFRQYELNVRGTSTIGDVSTAPNYEQAQMAAQAELARKEMFRDYEMRIRGETSTPVTNNAAPEYEAADVEARRQAGKEARQRMFKAYEANVRKDDMQDSVDPNLVPDYATSEQVQADRAARKKLFDNYETATDQSPGPATKLASSIANTKLASKGARFIDKLTDKLGKGKGRAED